MKFALFQPDVISVGAAVRPLALALVSVLATLTPFPGAPRIATRSTLSPVSPAPASLGRTAMARTGPLGPAALRFGRSIGSPTDGRLLGGMHLDDAPYLRIVPAYASGDVRWGLEPLVAMLDRAARSVRRQFRDAVTSVGHLSRAGGGDIDRHRSHESGRDADVSFFVRTASGKPLLPSRFVPFRPDGSADGWPGAYFDDARNWALVAAMVADPEAHVTHLFVAAPLRARLLAYAERVGVSPALRMHAAEVMQQPRGALPHDDHFHVRIGCPSRMNGCVENPAARQAPPPLVATGRRGGLVERPITPAPRRAAAPLPPPAPAEPAARPEPRDDGDAPPEPAAPPAVLPAPVDDVDG